MLNLHLHLFSLVFSISVANSTNWYNLKKKGLDQRSPHQQAWKTTEEIKWMIEEEEKPFTASQQHFGGGRRFIGKQSTVSLQSTIKRCIHEWKYLQKLFYTALLLLSSTSFFSIFYPSAVKGWWVLSSPCWVGGWAGGRVVWTPMFVNLIIWERGNVGASKLHHRCIY